MKCKYPIEIIGVNNDSQDKTEDIFKAVGLPYYNEYQHSCGYARKCGLQHAKGKFHINIDADTLYPPKYVEIMVDSLIKPGVVAASSLWSYIPDKDHSWIGLKLYEFTLVLMAQPLQNTSNSPVNSITLYTSLLLRNSW